MAWTIKELRDEWDDGRKSKKIRWSIRHVMRANSTMRNSRGHNKVTLAMETSKHLDLAWTRDKFRFKPNHKLARWYLQNLIRARTAYLIGDEEYLDGMNEIKAWMATNKISY